MSRSLGSTISFALFATVSLGACSRTQPEPKQPLGTPAVATGGGAPDALAPAARGALDLGNLEFRAGRYAEALTAYRDAAKAAPDNVAPYFGIFMAAKKLGNTSLADSASKVIAQRGNATPMLSDSAMRALHAASKVAGAPTK